MGFWVSKASFYKQKKAHCTLIGELNGDRERFMSARKCILNHCRYNTLDLEWSCCASHGSGLQALFHKSRALPKLHFLSSFFFDREDTIERNMIAVTTFNPIYPSSFLMVCSDVEWTPRLHEPSGCALLFTLIQHCCTYWLETTFAFHQK